MLRAMVRATPQQYGKALKLPLVGSVMSIGPGVIEPGGATRTSRGAVGVPVPAGEVDSRRRSVPLTLLTQIR